MLNVKNLCSRWWAKFSNFIGHPNLHSIRSRKHQVVVVELRPLFIGQRDVFLENSFGTLVIKTQTLCDGLKSSGRCRLRNVVASMNHERCLCASLTFLGAEISERGDGLYRADVIQRQIKLKRLEEVVETNAITDITAGRLK